MKILMFSPDPNGIPTYSGYLIGAMNKNIEIKYSSNLDDYLDYNIIHIQFEHSLFHPFGLRLIPILIKLKIRGKKIVLTSHTVLSKKEIYARNKFFAFIKKILLPMGEKVMGWFYDKIIVHTNHSKDILIYDYNINSEKIEVIPHGAY